MRLVAVSIVKNEADIIEPFVRHTLAWVDQHLVFDHDSTDGTREILHALRAEGLPIRIFTDDALGKLQQFRSNHLSRLAAREGADWIIPLDADEILCGPGRVELEAELARTPPGSARSLPLVNHLARPEDDPAETNPVLRLQHCESGPHHTRKVLVAQALALDESVVAGMGSHVLLRDGTPLPDLSLPDAFYLAHFPLRSPQHQALRVVLAELQKLSHGQAHADVDVHYRLGFQLLGENPDLFFAVATSPAGAGLHRPALYRGGPLHHSAGTAGWNRVVRSLLPYLEKLAASHGRLVDGQSADPGQATHPVIRELPPAGLPPPALQAGPAFAGFVAVDGWGPQEGPVPAAFLPPFHWGYAPATRLVIKADGPHPARLIGEVLTYSPGQAIVVELNGVPVLQHALPRINQKERLAAVLPLQAGDNHLVLHYSQALVTGQDARRLAVIFLALRILEEGTL